jgi:hypothetical protein
MKENVVAAIAAISVPTRAGPWEDMFHPRKTTMEFRDSIVIAYSFSSPLHGSGLLITSIPQKRMNLTYPIICVVQIIVSSMT